MKMKIRILPMIAMLAALPLAGCYEYSAGDRAGVINKFSKKGLICKTWEGEMVLGGFKNKKLSNIGADGSVSYSTQMAANVFEFTVEDPKLVSKIQDALNSGEPVMLHYSQEFISWPCRTSSDGNYFVTGVN
jgi:hypothetical protein